MDKKGWNSFFSCFCIHSSKSVFLNRESGPFSPLSFYISYLDFQSVESHCAQWTHSGTLQSILSSVGHITWVISQGLCAHGIGKESRKEGERATVEYYREEVVQTHQKWSEKKENEAGEIGEILAHEWKYIVEWQGEKLREKYNRYGEAGLEMYGNGDWKLETKQWQNGR